MWEEWKTEYDDEVGRVCLAGKRIRVVENGLKRNGSEFSSKKASHSWFSGEAMMINIDQERVFAVLYIRIIDLCIIIYCIYIYIYKRY